jgi:hypothetical protein
MKFLLASLKIQYLLILKIAPKAIKFQFRFSFALIGRIFLMYIPSRLLEQFLESSSLLFLGGISIGVPGQDLDPGLPFRFESSPSIPIL